MLNWMGHDMMETVVVFPERCIGCMQCMFQCAVSHSKSKDLTAIFEELPPKPRIHVYPARENYAFPSKCRHCDPAP
ncbi:MAG: 4Fe-4S dicluster domain-containing protein, partial [Candidatus Alkanophagales archaeon]